MNQDRGSAYDPKPHICDLFIHRIDDAHGHSIVTDSSLRDLFDDICRNDATGMNIFEVAGHGRFILWTVPIRTSTTKSLDDACIASKRFIQQNIQRQTCILMKSGQGRAEALLTCPNSSILMVLARCDRSLVSSLGLPLGLQRMITHTHGSAADRRILLGASTSRRVLRQSFLLILIFFSCSFVGLTLIAINAMTVNPPGTDYAWMAYNTRGSIGPKYQLSISSSNASAWASSFNDGGDWVLRVDDQAIIPGHLMDDEEKHYQDWLRKQYPEVDRIRLNLDYLNETWLGSPAVDQVPVDDLFHFSHCVLALRRYIKAKRTGSHVCGRDIDHDHMHHCLDALDWWAFPEAGRMESFPNVQRPFGWRTKVCF